MKNWKRTDYLQTFKQNQVAGILAATHYPRPSRIQRRLYPVVFLDRTKKAPHPYSVTGGQAENGRLRKCFAAKAQASRLSKAQPTFRPLKNVLTAHLTFAKSERAVQCHLRRFIFHQGCRHFSRRIVCAYPETDGVIASNDIGRSPSSMRRRGSAKSSGGDSDHRIRRYSAEQAFVSASFNHPPACI